MKWGGIRLPSGRDQGEQENRGQDSYSGEGMGSSDSLSDKAVKELGLLPW